MHRNYSIETKLRLKQSVRLKGGTMINPKLFELRVEHPPPEKKNKKNIYINIIAAIMSTSKRK